MTVTAEQLDELERKAKAAGGIRWYGLHDVHLDYMRDVDAYHIAANSPDVTLYLVAIARAALAWSEAKKRFDSWKDLSTDGVRHATDALLSALKGTP